MSAKPPTSQLAALSLSHVNQISSEHGVKKAKAVIKYLEAHLGEPVPKPRKPRTKKTTETVVDVAASTTPSVPTKVEVTTTATNTPVAAVSSTPTKKKRRLTHYNLYVQVKSKEAEIKAMKFVERGKHLGALWKGLSAADKATWIAAHPLPPA